MTAKVVYAVIAARVWQGDTSRIGMRLIADVLHVSLYKVNSAVNELLRSGHLKRMSQGKSRGMYILASEVFARKQGHIDEVASGPSGVRRFVSMERKRA